MTRSYRRSMSRAAINIMTTCVALATFSGCGGSDEDSSDKAIDSGDGTVRPPWDAYCVGTFTVDHAATDFFGDEVFTATAGSSYLIRDLNGGRNDEVDFFYLTNGGPKEFSAPGGADAPFETACSDGDVTEYIGVFADVVVYAEESLDTQLCSLRAGTVAARDAESLSGFNASDISFNAPMVYEFYLNALSEQCGDAEIGYVEVPESVIWGAHTHPMPIQHFIGPAL